MNLIKEKYFGEIKSFKRRLFFFYELNVILWDTNLSETFGSFHLKYITTRKINSGDWIFIKEFNINLLGKESKVFIIKKMKGNQQKEIKKHLKEESLKIFNLLINSGVFSSIRRKISFLNKRF